MKHTFNDTRSQLIISADANERANLRELSSEEICTDKAMHEFFESLICNSEFDWIAPENTGDLTDAPMIGILNTPEFRLHNLKTVQNPLNIIVSCDTHGLMVARVVERWAFMGYETKSVLEDLRDKGEVIFIGGKL